VAKAREKEEVKYSATDCPKLSLGPKFHVSVYPNIRLRNN